MIGPTTLVMKYGSFAVAGVVCLESMGLPLPGEAILIAAAIYAGKTGGLIRRSHCRRRRGRHRRRQYRLLDRERNRLPPSRPLWSLCRPQRGAHQSGTIFIPEARRQDCLLRALHRAAQGLAALLAGVNRMSWPRFFFFNAAGAILWATVFGLGAYTLGEEIEHLTKPAAIALAVAGVAAIVIWVLFLHSRREELEAELGARCLGRSQRGPSSAPRGDEPATTGLSARRRSATDEAAVLPIGSLYHAAFGRHPFAKHEGFQRFGDPASLLVLL